MIDAILYVPDYPELVRHLASTNPKMLAHDNNGQIPQPPTVTGFARTPAVTTPDGVSLLVYARLRETEAQEWRGMPGVEVLAEAVYQGRGTAESVYGQVFNDPEKLAKYDSAYQRMRTTTDAETGEEQQIRQDKFGILAGA